MIWIKEIIFTFPNIAKLCWALWTGSFAIPGQIWSGDTVREIPMYRIMAEVGMSLVCTVWNLNVFLILLKSSQVVYLYGSNSWIKTCNKTLTEWHFHYNIKFVRLFDCRRYALYWDNIIMSSLPTIFVHSTLVQLSLSEAPVSPPYTTDM